MTTTSDCNYRPTTADVGVLLRARLVDGYGKRLTDWDSTTTPTDTEVDEQIDEAIGEVSQEIGYIVPDDRVDQALRVVQILAAANVELSFFPEQAAANNSMYDKLMARYTTMIAGLEQSISSEDTVEMGPPISGSGSFVGNAYWGFPPAQGFGTRLW
jgi:molybdopterin converting factor small subunit